MLRILLAALHLLALGLGLGAVWIRARALSATVDGSALRRALAADSLWGIAAVLWIGTGVWRLFGAVEKSTSYYFANHIFLGKMALLGLILVLEIVSMTTLIRWRVALGRAGSPEAIVTPAAARRIAMISYGQAGLVVLMVFAAVAMARGYGARG